MSKRDPWDAYWAWLEGKDSYQDLPARGLLQHKGSTYCMDFKCECGATAHLDTDCFAYHVKCAACGALYAVSSVLQMHKIPPEHVKYIEEERGMIVSTADNAPPPKPVRTIRVAVDMGGVITRSPDTFRLLMYSLEMGGAEVYVLTDMTDRALVMELLQKNRFRLPEERVLCADYATHGERCKAVLIEKHQIDVLIDDHPGYCAAKHRALSLFLWPNPDEPYYSDDFKGDMPWRRSK